MTSRTRLRPLLVLLVAALLLAASCSDDSSGGATGEAGGAGASTTAAAEEDGSSSEAADGTSPEVSLDAPVEVETDDALYAVPDPIPAGDHGTLLKYQEISPSPVEGATTYRVMYLSESLEGEPIVVTGVTVVPDAAAPADGRTTLTIAHGTSGIADECAPSKEAEGGELLLAGLAVSRGWIMTLTDYEGMGTPGRHPYLVGESEGRSTIDAALAAGALPDAEQGSALAIAGYSQGGHGALFAGEIAPEWAPDLDVIGTFAGAPATELDVIMKAAGGVVGFGMMIVAGYEAAYPEADPSVFLTDEGVSRLDVVDEGCTGEIFSAVSDVPGSELVRAGGADEEPWASLGLENNPGQVRTEAPILIIHSDEDDVVPVGLSAALFARMCGLDQVVERRVLAGGGSHTGAAPAAYAQAMDWFDGLIEGTEPVTTCPAA